MQTTWVAIVLGNAVLAAVLALGIVLLARWYHKPALLHGLWVVVLLKLLTPPLWTIPVPVLEAVETSSPIPESTAVAAIPEATTAQHPAEPPDIQSEMVFQSPPTIMIESPPELAEVPDRKPENQIDPQGNFDPTSATQPAPVAVEVFPLEVAYNQAKPSVSKIISPTTSSTETETAVVPLAHAENTFSWQMLMMPLAIVWGLGIVMVFLSALREILRFERTLKNAEPAGESLALWVEELAKRAGLRRTPEVFLLGGTVSPMLWGFGRHPRLLLPCELLNRLDEEATESLILHELAHMKRGDHWVRVLELICQCLYWWHPLVWWARKQLRNVEEECCDAFVVEHCQGGVYANALVTTVDFLSNHQTALPPAASGLGNLEFLKRRLTMIMQGGVSARLAGLPKVLLLAAALICLSILPKLVAQSDPSETDAAEPEAATDLEEEKKPVSTKQPDPKTKIPMVMEIGQEPLSFESKPQGYPLSELEVRSLDYSPDGKLLAAGYGRWDSAGEMVVYESVTRKVLKVVKFEKGVASVVFSPDGNLLAVSYWNVGVQVWDTKTWTMKTEKTTGSKISRLDFSPDGKHLAAATEDGALMMWDVGMWEESRPFTGEFFRFQKLAFSPDGKMLAVVGGSFNEPRFGRGLIFDVATKKQIAKIESTQAVFAGVAFSPDGKELVTGEFGNTVTFWDPLTGKSTGTLSLSGTVRELNYAPDGQRLAVACGDRTVYLLKNHVIERRIAGHQNEALSAVFTPDGKTLATGSQDATLRLWNPDNGTFLAMVLPSNAQADSQEAVLAVAHSPDGRYVVSTHEDGSVRLREAEEGVLIRLFPGHEDVVTAAVFSPDSRRLATGSYDHGVKLWDVETGKLLQDLTGHTNWVFAVAFSPDGKSLASSGYDKTIRLWNVASGKSLAVLEGHSAAVRALAFSPDGKQLVSGSSDHLVKLWDVNNQKLLRDLKGHTAAVRAVAFAPDRSRIASGSEDKTVRQWNPDTGASVQELKGHTGMIWTLAYSPRGRTIASAGFDNTLRIWNTQTGASLQTLSGHQDVITSLSYAPSTDAILTGSYDKTLKRWPALAPPVPALADLNLNDGSKSPSVRFVVFTPDGKKMITGTQRQILQVWDLATGRTLKTAKQPRGISDGVLSADGRLLATTGYGEHCYLWNAETLELLASMDTGRNENVTAAFSSDGQILATAARDGMITIWDVNTREKLRELPQQKLPVGGLAFSPDGALLASATGDYKNYKQPGTVKLWDTESWNEIANLSGPIRKMRCVQFSPDGKTLVATGSQPELLVYDVSKKTLKAKLSFGTEVSAVTFLGDSQTVAMGGYDGRVSVWNLQTRKPLVNYEGHLPEQSNQRYIYHVAVAPDASVVASAGADGHVKLWPTSTLAPAKALVSFPIADAEIFHAAISPDGIRFVGSRSDKILEIRETKTGKILHTISGLNTFCAGVAFSPDGQLIAGALRGGRVVVWDANTAEEIMSAEAHTGGARRVDFSPDGKRVASCGWDGTAAVWNIADGSLSYRIENQNVPLSDVKFSPTGKLLFTASGSWKDPKQPGLVKAWKGDDGKFSKQIGNHEGEIKGISVNPGGRFLVSFGMNGAKVWNRSNSKLVKAFGKGTTISAACLSPDGEILYTGYLSGMVSITDVNTGKILRTMEGHEGIIHAMSFSTDGTVMLTSGKDGTIQLWPASRVPAPLLVQQQRDDFVETFTLAYSPDGQWIAIGGKDKTISILDAKTKTLKRELVGHNGRVFRVAFTPEGTQLVSGSSDGTVRLWDLSTGEQLVKWKAHGEKISDVRSIGVSPDGNQISAGNWAGETYVWDRKSQKLLYQLPKQALPVTGAVFSPDGKLLATSCGNWKEVQKPGEVILWEAQTGTFLATLAGHTAEIKGLLFSEDGKTLISYGSDKTIRTWDVAAKKQVASYTHSRIVISLAFLDDNLAFGDFQGSVYVMDRKRNAIKMQTGGHFSQIASIAFSPISPEFSTVALDGYFKTWSTKTPPLAIFQVPRPSQIATIKLAERIRDWQPLVQPTQSTAGK